MYCSTVSPFFRTLGRVPKVRGNSAGVAVLLWARALGLGSTDSWETHIGNERLWGRTDTDSQPVSLDNLNLFYN